MLTSEQVADLKRQLEEQIQHLPEHQKIEAKKQIDNLSNESLEAMLEEQKVKPATKENPLRLIISGKLPAYHIDENKSAMAVLDIRPISKGHILIIPRQPVLMTNGMPTEAFTLGKKISRRIKSKIRPKGIEMQTETKFNEQVINVIPFYDKPKDISSPRYNATEEELKEIQLKLSKKTRKTIKKENNRIKEIKQDPSRIILKRRIP